MNQEDLLPSLLTDKNVGQRDKDPLFETNSNHQPEKKGLLTTEPKQKINLKKEKENHTQRLTEPNLIITMIIKYPPCCQLFHKRRRN